MASDNIVGQELPPVITGQGEYMQTWPHTHSEEAEIENAEWLAGEAAHALKLMFTADLHHKSAIRRFWERIANLAGVYMAE